MEHHFNMNNTADFSIHPVAEGDTVVFHIQNGFDVALRGAEDTLTQIVDNAEKISIQVEINISEDQWRYILELLERHGVSNECVLNVSFTGGISDDTLALYLFRIMVDLNCREEYRIPTVSCLRNKLQELLNNLNLSGYFACEKEWIPEVIAEIDRLEASEEHFDYLIDFTRRKAHEHHHEDSNDEGMDDSKAMSDDDDDDDDEEGSTYKPCFS